MKELKTLIIRFDTPIRFSEIPLLRGAIASTLPRDSVLFHNHMGEKLRYSYPLIQYKCISGKAALLGMGKGTESMWDFFAGNKFDLRLGRRMARLNVDDISNADTPIELSQDSLPHSYEIRNWLPLNSDNYAHFAQEPSLSERIGKLEQILKGNILSMLKGNDLYIDEELQVSISALSKPTNMRFKKVPLVAYNAEFQSNMPLPLYIGLGKHVSVGFGTVYPQRQTK